MKRQNTNKTLRPQLKKCTEMSAVWKVKQTCSIILSTLEYISCMQTNKLINSDWPTAKANITKLQQRATYGGKVSNL